MKLRELLEKFNAKMLDLQGIKYENSEQLSNTIIMKLHEVEIELGDLLRIDERSIRLITKDDINVFGSVGELLFESHIDVKKDKRVKNGNKGTILNVEFYPSKGTYEILDMELLGLQKHYDKINKANEIKWYDDEIKRLENKISELKQEREKLIGIK